MEENTKVYVYYVCTHDVETGGFLEDRGITFAATLGEAIHKTINSVTSATEEAIHVDVSETDYTVNDDTFSVYGILSESCVTKRTLERELADWCLI